MAKKKILEAPANIARQAKSRGGLTLAAAAALAAAGYYYFYASKDGAKRRKKVTEWSKQMKTEVHTRVADLKKVNQETILATIASVGKAYRAFTSVSRAELTEALAELKSHWRDIRDEVVAANKNKDERSKKKTRTSKDTL